MVDRRALRSPLSEGVWKKNVHLQKNVTCKEVSLLSVNKKWKIFCILSVETYFAIN